MQEPAEMAISHEQLTLASKNYLRCLKLPPLSQVLIITDKLPTGEVDQNLKIRREISEALIQQINKDHPEAPVAKVEFGEEPNMRELHGETARALKELNEFENPDNVKRTTTVIYLGSIWKDRKGIYQAADEFGKNNIVKLSGSLGFSTGDCRVMSQVGEEQLEKITQVNEYFETFFKEKPKGSFKITTKNGEKAHVLDLDYDTSHAPFGPELGYFDGKHESPLGGYPNLPYINIPGGEIYGTPYPFTKSNGTFFAEGITFTVENGLLTRLEIGKNVVIEKLTASQQELIKIIQAGKSLPIAELGLGFYELAGIKTYSDSSTLSHEKSGPHIAFGHSVEYSIEEEEIAKLSGGFFHADFVSDGATITWAETKDGEQIQFYPH